MSDVTYFPGEPLAGGEIAQWRRRLDAERSLNADLQERLAEVHEQYTQADHRYAALRRTLDAVIAERDAEQLAALSFESKLAERDRRSPPQIDPAAIPGEHELQIAVLEHRIERQAETIRNQRAGLEDAQNANEALRALMAASGGDAVLIAERRRFAALEETLDRRCEQVQILSQVIAALSQPRADVSPPRRAPDDPAPGILSPRVTLHDLRTPRAAASSPGELPEAS